MENEINFTNISLLILGSAVLASVFVIGGCQINERYNEPDPEIATSTEMEDFIIAATDLEQSLKLFEQELNKIDFRTLETVMEDGKDVTYLPRSVREIDLDGKLLVMNESKEALHKKFPKFQFLSKNEKMRYFESSVQNSERVAGKLLEFGHDFTRPLLSTRLEFRTESALLFYLHGWINSSKYVEVYIVQYNDGIWELHQISGATAGNAGDADILTSDTGTYFLNGSRPGTPIVKIGHTHSHSSEATKPSQKEDGTTVYNDYFM